MRSHEYYNVYELLDVTEICRKEIIQAERHGHLQ